MRAYSLLELLIVFSIMTIVLMVSIPVMEKPLQDSYFQSFACELAGTLVLARKVALIGGNKVTIELEDDETIRYICFTQRMSEREILTINTMGRGHEKKIKCQLLPNPLPHPTRSGTIDSAFGSTHYPRIVFTQSGSSNATVVFSDGETRALCAVVSGQTGRFRIYSWDYDAQKWIPFY